MNTSCEQCLYVRHHMAEALFCMEKQGYVAPNRVCELFIEVKPIVSERALLKQALAKYKYSSGYLRAPCSNGLPAYVVNDRAIRRH